MSTRVRSYLAAGAAAATATAIALTPIQAAPADIAVPAHPTSTQPQLTQAMVDLLAAASRMTAAVTPKAPAAPGAPALGLAPAAAAQPTAIAIAPNLANTIDQIYVTVEPWVRYGFQLGAYALGWVPWVGGWAGGLLMDGYNFGQSLVASGVFNFTDWLRGDGGFIQNLADFGVDAARAVVKLGIDIINTFIPLPPLPPLPPRPSLKGPFLASLAGPTVLAGTVSPSPLRSFTDGLARAGEDFSAALKSLTHGTDLAPLANRFKVQAAAGEENPVAGPIEDVEDAVVNDTKDFSNNIDQHNPVDQQVKPAADHISLVPRSVRESLRSARTDTAVTETAGTDTAVTGSAATETDKAPARSLRSGRQAIRTAIDKTAADAKKAGEDAREAVKSAVKNVAPKPKLKQDRTTSVNQSKDSNGSGKPDNDKK